MTGRRTAVRLAIPLVWAVAMIAARWFDPLRTIFAASAILTVAVLTSDGALIRRLLQPSLRATVLGLSAATAMLVGTYLLFPLLARAIPEIPSMSAEVYSRFLYGRSPMATILVVIPLVLAEEILWRGAFQEAMQAKSRVLVVLVSATVYAAAHVPLGSSLLVAVAFVCGIYWAALRTVSGSLLPSLAAHLAWDVALILIPLVPHPALR